MAYLRGPNEVVSAHVDRVAAEKHFYKLRRTDGTLSDDLEDALADFDGTIPEIVRRATSRERLADADIADLKKLYANLCSRAKLGRDLLIEEVAALRDWIERDFESEFPGERAGDHASLLDSIVRHVYDHPTGYAADPETVSRLGVLQLAADIEKIMPLYACVLESTVEIITSDAPCSAFDAAAPPEGDSLYGPDYSASRIELTLPLGRRHVALFSNIPLPARGKMNGLFAVIVNARTAFFAERMIFSHHSEDAATIAVANVIESREFCSRPLLWAFEAAIF